MLCPWHINLNNVCCRVQKSKLIVWISFNTDRRQTHILFVQKQTYRKASTVTETETIFDCSEDTSHTSTRAPLDAPKIDEHS